MPKKNPERKYHHGDLRRDLMEAARQEISRSGAQSVSLTSLARLTGVSQPAPYRHFADREALFAALAAQGFQELAELIREAAAKAGRKSGWRAMAIAYVAFGEENIELYRLMFASHLVPEAEPESELARAADQAFELLREAMQQVRRSSRQAYLLWAQLHGLVMLRADGFLEESCIDLARQAVRM